MSKPRVKFCWECGKKLYGNHHKVEIINGEECILHISCAKNRTETEYEHFERNKIERLNNKYGVDDDQNRYYQPVYRKI